MFFCNVHGGRIKNLHPRPCFEQFLYDADRRRFPHVVGLRLECKAPNSNDAAVNGGDMLHQFFVEMHFLTLIHLLHGPHNAKLVPVIPSRLRQCIDVLRKAAAAKTDARMQKPAPDAIIESHSPFDRGDVSSDAFAELGDLVHEGYFCCKKRI